jgi:8-oxo-dGTP pyrophosphatase MutT (NUDIX family)
MPKFLQQKSKYDNSKVEIKAGLIPFYKHPDGTIEFLFMVSSNPKFGGPDPMISKGGIEPGEGFKDTAVREAEEELGLKRNNVISGLITITDDIVKGLDNSYRMVVYACEVKTKNNFSMHHYETAYTTWMTNELFQSRGRSEHRRIVQKAFNIISGT